MLDQLVSFLAALATEDPVPDLLLEAPHGRNEPLINGTMWVHLTVQAAYQILILFLIIYGAPNAIDRYRLPSPCNTYSNIDGAVSFLYFDPTERPILFVLWHCLHARWQAMQHNQHGVEWPSAKRSAMLALQRSMLAL